MPYDLKLRDVNRRFFVWAQRLLRQEGKGFLHRIVTGGEKSIHCTGFARNDLGLLLVSWSSLPI